MAMRSKSITLAAMGADPVTISLQRPPRISFVFLNTRASHSQCVYLQQQRHACMHALDAARARHKGTHLPWARPALLAARAALTRLALQP